MNRLCRGYSRGLSGRNVGVARKDSTAETTRQYAMSSRVEFLEEVSEVRVFGVSII